MVNYQNGKIYKIECLITGEYYIGSTCEPTLAQRLTKHVSSCKQWKIGKPTTTSFNILKRGNYKIYLIELYPCNSRDELHKREGEVIKLHKSSQMCLNRYIAGRKSREYYNDNKDILQDYKKTYYEDNKNKILDYHKDYYEANKDKMIEKQKVYNLTNREKISNRQKIFREENKEKIILRDKQYREDNKEMIATKSTISYKENKEKIKEQQKKYREKNKGKIKEHIEKYVEENKEKISKQRKQFREDNKEKLKEISKKYREDNKDKIKERKALKVVCECGSYICKGTEKRHSKTSKHALYLKSLQNIKIETV
jgi:hypothetical protein